MKHFSPVLRIFLMLCICLSLLALSPARVDCTGNWTVTSLADSGAGSLAQCHFDCSILGISSTFL